MAYDIIKAKSANNIKNGTCVVQCKVTGFSSSDLLNTSVSNLPSIIDIQDRYDERFDDPSYYFGGGGVDGGDVVVP